MNSDEKIVCMTAAPINHVNETCRYLGYILPTIPLFCNSLVPHVITRSYRIVAHGVIQWMEIFLIACTNLLNIGRVLPFVFDGASPMAMNVV